MKNPICSAVGYCSYLNLYHCCTLLPFVNVPILPNPWYFITIAFVFEYSTLLHLAQKEFIKKQHEI